MKRALDLAYRVQKRLWRLLRPETRGVKVLLFNDAGEVLLIRNSYGRSDLFVLPGGGVRPFEQPELAARREIAEELGCEVAGLAAVSTHFSSAEGKRDTIHLYSGHLHSGTGGTVKQDDFEVEEARFFPLDSLPPNISAATLRRIEEQAGKRTRDGTW